MLTQFKPDLTWEDEHPAEHNIEAAMQLKTLAEEYGIHLALKDLENDLAVGPLHDQLAEYYEKQNVEDIVEQMQTRKAESMYSFLKEGPDLTPLVCNFVTAPLRALADKAINVDVTN